MSYIYVITVILFSSFYFRYRYLPRFCNKDEFCFLEFFINVENVWIFSLEQLIQQCVLKKGHFEGKHPAWKHKAVLTLW